VLNSPLSPADQAAKANNGGFALSIGPGGNSHFVTYCRGQARLRILDSALAVSAVAAAAFLAIRRRRGRPSPGYALQQRDPDPSDASRTRRPHARIMPDATALVSTEPSR
jgi:hypothetical protein